MALFFLCLNFKKAKSEDFKHEYEKTVKQEMKRPQKANKEGIKRCLNKKNSFYKFANSFCNVYKKEVF